MLVSFTQTYGNARRILYNAYSKDKQMIKFKSLFDINLHAFHNCSKETIDYYKKVNEVPNSEYIYFNDISYGECIAELKKKLNELNCTHFFFSQDDSFSVDDEEVDYEGILEYVKKHDKNFMLNLSYNPERTFIGAECNSEYEDHGTFKVYHTTTFDYKKFNHWAMNDEPYIATIDIINKLYDETYVKKGDIWSCEYYLTEKYEKEELERYMLNKMLFNNYNIVGRFTGSSRHFYTRLKNRKMI